MTPVSPRGSSDTRTTPADSIATSVPAPMAMPTSARARAGASFTPSPTIATRSPVPGVRRRGVLVCREHLGEDFVDAKIGGDRVGDLLRVARDQRDALPRSWSASTAGGSGRTSSATLTAPITRSPSTMWITASPRSLQRSLRR